MFEKWNGTAWRAKSGYRHDAGATARDIVEYEQTELGNNIGVSASDMEALSLVPADRCLWVCRTRHEAMRYGKPEMVDVGANAYIVAYDWSGGYLVVRA